MQYRLSFCILFIMDKQTEQKLREGQKTVNNYAKYSGLAFQMIGAILLGVWGGRKLDAWLDLSFPAFTVGLSLLGIAASLIVLIRGLPKE